MRTDRRRRAAPAPRVCTWLLPSLLAALVTAAGCHDLELSQLRCSLAGACPSGYACGADGFCRRQSENGRVAGPPGSKKQGEACASGDECVTHACTDGVCCDTGCTDACHACNLPDNIGTCVAIARGGAPVHDVCEKQSPQSCGTNGLCDGDGHCAVYDATTVCGDASCDKGSNTFVHEAHCDGFGTCAGAGTPLSCAPFTCRPDGKGCADRCGSTSECVQPNVCSGGSCGPIGNGLPCRNASQCQSGFCVDGVCCNAPCTEQCMACDLTPSLGTCAQVPAGNPHGGRSACAGAGTTCGGQCTAASGTACTYPGGAMICRSASCANGAASASQSSAAGCDGAGSCTAGVATSCGIYMCAAGGVCAATCAGDFDCAAGYICQDGSCQAKGMAASPCTTTSQCAAGLTCKDGVCCESACADSCHTCNAAGQTGHCVVVASADDPDSCPADTRTCDAAGACKLRDQQSCGAGGDCAGGACTTLYPDADGDSFGDRAATVANGKAKQICGGAATAGWVTSNTDCCDAGDTNKAVHPGQTAWFTTPGPCAIQFDYDCDGMTAVQYPATGQCDPTLCSAGFVAATACGAMGDFQTCDAALPLICAAPAAQAQGCH
jgi:hypothetical protein